LKRWKQRKILNDFFHDVKIFMYQNSLTSREIKLLAELKDQDNKILELSTVLLRIKHVNHGMLHEIDELVDGVL